MERREFLKKAILATAATAVAVAVPSQVQAMIDDNIDTTKKNTPWFNLDSWSNKKRDCVLLMTARGNDYTMALDQYGIFTKYLGWNSLGTVLGRGLTDEARTLGASIK